MHTNIPNTRLDTLIKAVLTGVAPLKKGSRHDCFIKISLSATLT